MKVFSIFVMVSLFLAAASLTPPPTVAASSDVLVYGHEDKIATFDHYKTSSNISWIIGFLMWDTLVEMDPKTNKIVPSAAESWSLINDTTWEFILRPGIKFHNGNPLNAEAVRFTIEDAIIAPPRNSTRTTHFKWVKKVEVVDDLRFRIITEGPYPLVLERLYNMFIYDPISAKEKGFDHLAENPMGSGPYKLVKWERGSELVVARNPEYWKKEVGKIQTIRIRTIPEPSTRLAELISGGIHLTTGLPGDMLENLEKAKNAEPMVTDVCTVNFWQFDSMGRAAQTPLMDKRIRRAIWHAIDRETIVKSMLPGMARVIDSSVSPMMFGFDPNMKGYEYNPDKAKALLKEAGYEKGFSIDLWQYLNHQNHPNQAAMGYLEKVGIKVTLKDYTGNIGQMVTLRNTGKITGIGNFEWFTGILDAEAILSAWFAKSPMDYSNDEELDKLVNEARTSLDPEKRKALYSKVQAKVLDEAYWMPIYAMKMLSGKAKNLQVDMMAGQTPWLKMADWKK
jgi:peptide/nickel transport system substrate-binding protein